MKSIQILQSYKSEPVTSVSYYGPFLIIGGGEYSKVKYVIVDGVKAEELYLRGGRLWIRMPSSQDPRQVESIFPISETDKVDKSCLLRASFGIYPKQTYGISRLIQLFVKTLFTTQGTNVIYKTLGGGLGNIFNRGYTGGDVSKVIPDIVAAIGKAERDIKEMQTGLSIPADERLASASVSSIFPDQNAGSVDCTITLTTQRGETGGFSLTF